MEARFDITRYYGPGLENTKIHFQNLYLRRIFYGNNNSNEDGPAFGTTASNNWALIYDGPGSQARIVARAKGIHADPVSWYISFVMVFEAERFQESGLPSTLAVMGTFPPVAHERASDLAIVGGTGQFGMARGFLKRALHERAAGEDVQVLTIEAYCRMKLPVTRMQLAGSEDGGDRDINAAMKPERLQRVTIRTGGVIDAFTFSYIDQDGEQRIVGPWGAGGPDNASTTTILLGPSEVVKGILGTMGKIEHTETAPTVITSLRIVTNIQTYGPIGDPIYYGANNNRPFSILAPENKSIVAFFGRSSRYLNAIGVYTI